MASSSKAPPQDGLTPAQRLMQQHTAHQPTVEEVEDEEYIAHPPVPSQNTAPTVAPPTDSTPTPSMSAEASGKQKARDVPLEVPPARKPTNPILDVQSEEAFPSLGPSRSKTPTATAWGQPPAIRGNRLNGGAGATNGAYQTPSNPSSGISTPASVSRPSSSARNVAQPLSLPGRYTEDMQMLVQQLRKDLKKPVADILKDINKKSKARVEMTRSNDIVTFRGQGPTQESVQQILKEVAAQAGKKETITVPVPAALRAYVIGKQGSTIQGISKRSGARVQMPKLDNVAQGLLDEDSTVDVEIEGNPIAVRLARNEIEAIVGSRTSNVNLKMKEVPPEFFPFIAGPDNSRVNALEEGRDIRIDVPHYHTWQAQPPPEPQSNDLLDFQPQEGYHIQVVGEREAARNVQNEIQRQVLELQNRLTTSQLQGIERERHYFILGDNGQGLNDFLRETGCSIVMPPPSEDSQTITIIGPPDQIDVALNKAIDLASSMQVTNVDVTKQHPGPASDPHAHSRALGRYMRQKRALERLEDQHKAQVMLTTRSQSEDPWKVFTKDPRQGFLARTEILNLVSGHPPSRFRHVDVHPFYQRHLEAEHASLLRDQHGVHVVVPQEEDNDPSRVLLVYEGPGNAESYVFPNKKPTAEEAAQFEKALAEAEQLLLELIGDQQQIVERNVEAPVKYREKLARHVNRERNRETEERYPVQLFGLEHPIVAPGSEFPIRLQGPSAALDEYAEKIANFIREQIRDEAERDYTVTCDFPQKFANVLIGKKGENINNLRDEFDVDIQVADGKVEIKGPKAKADACKAHILSLGRKLEDETTYSLKIDPKFHRELIGAKGSQVLKLQERYNVRIMFPRSAASAADDESLADGSSDAGVASRRRGPPQAPDEVVIKGPKKGADEARSELLALYEYLKEISHTATVSVAQSQLPSLIGQGGRELQNLREATGAEIDVPGSKVVVDDSGRVEVKIKGKKEAVANAKKLIEARAKTFDESTSRSLEVDRKHHRALIGRDGENIRQIIQTAGGTGDARELARMVQFPKINSEGNAIRIEGRKDVVDKIVQAIEEFVKLRESQVTEVIEVPVDRHGALIGRGGQVRKGLETDHSITLHVPSTSTTGPARSQIKITGMPSDVEKAKERILVLLQEHRGETIMVPKRVHHIIADKGDFFRVLNRDLRVTVDHQGQRPPKPESKASPRPNGASMPLITDDAVPTTDMSAAEVEAKMTWDVVPSVSPPEVGAEDPAIPWVLKGPDAESVAQAKVLVENAIAAAQDAVIGYLVLPDPKAHKSVIGQGGSTVNRIREATGCKIDVPKAGESGAIEIRGSKDKVNEAKAMVVEAVTENLAR